MAKNSALLGLVALAGGVLLLRQASAQTQSSITYSISGPNCTIADETVLSDGTVLQTKSCGGSISITNKADVPKNIFVNIVAFEQIGQTLSNVGNTVVDFNTLDTMQTAELPYFLNTEIIKGDKLVYKFEFVVDGKLDTETERTT